MLLLVIGTVSFHMLSEQLHEVPFLNRSQWWTVSSPDKSTVIFVA